MKDWNYFKLLLFLKQRYYIISEFFNNKKGVLRQLRVSLLKTKAKEVSKSFLSIISFPEAFSKARKVLSHIKNFFGVFFNDELLLFQKITLIKLKNTLTKKNYD